MIAQRACAQYTLTTNTLDLIQVLSRQTCLLVIFIFLNLISPSLVQSQKLNLPSERFPCGPSNLTCQRWGYTACVSPDGEYYCLPCHHEYLRTLCGTKEEVQGCNLYCTEIRVDAEVTKLKSDFSRQIEVIKNNFTNILTDAHSDFNEKLQDQQADLTKCDKDKDLYINRTKTLEKELSKGSYFTKCLQWELGGLAASYAVAGVCLAIWCLKCRKRNKTSADIETSEQLTLLTADASNRSISELSEESEVKKVFPTIFQDSTTQTEHDNANTGSKGKGSEKLTECAENGCPTKEMFRNVPPATENGSDKMAIQIQDHDCTLNKHP